MKKYPATKKPSSSLRENKSVSGKTKVSNNRFSKKYLLGLSVVLILFVLVGYSSLSKNNLLNWDDNLYVTENADITSLHSENIKTFFTQKYVSNYLPLTMISYALNYKIDKLNPKVYTYTNLFFHIINSLLVFWLITILLQKKDTEGVTKPDTISGYLVASVAALLFAVHPLQVESVAWVSERKNVLYTLFFLLSLICYARFVIKEKYSLLLLSILLFGASLLSKGVAVSLTFCVVLIDYYYGRRLLSSKVILEKVPFIILSIVFGIVAFVSQYEESVLVGNVNFPLYEQLAFGGYGFINYLIKLCVPVNLSAYYSYPQNASAIHYLCLLLVVVLSAALLYYRKRLSRLVIFGILFYVANLVFLVQIIPVGNALMADRYIYVSSIGFFLLVALGLMRFIKNRNVFYIVVLVLISLYTFRSNQRVKVWNNSLDFWNDVITRDDHIPRAWNNRGVVKKDKGDNQGALSDFNRAIELMPEFHEAYNNQGIALFNLGRINESLASFTKAVELDSTYTDAFCNRGIVRAKTNDPGGSISDLTRTLRIDPDYLKAYTGRAEAKIMISDFNGAVSDCDKALSLNANFADAYSVKAFAYYNQGKYPESITNYSKAIEMVPQNLNNYHNRGAAFFYSANYVNAIKDMNVVVQNNPEQGVSYYIRGMSFVLSGNKQQGCSDLQTSINKGFAAAQADLNKYCQ